MINNFRRLIPAVFVASLTFSSALRAAIAPAENLLPADTLAFFTVPDCAAAAAAAKQSPGWLFWNDPAMKPFHDKLMAKVNERFLAPLETDLGLKVADFLELPQGQFTLGVTVNGSNGHDDIPAGLLLLLDAKDKSDVLKTNLAALTKKWTDAGRVLRTEKIHGLAFTVVPLKNDELAGIFGKRPVVSEIGTEPKPEKPGEIFFTQYETLLIAGNSPKVVEAVATHLTHGSAPALADDATFAADKLSQFRDVPVYYGWFNARLLFTMISQIPTSDSDDASSVMPKFSTAKIISAAGLNGLKSASFAMRETHDGSALNIHLTAPEAERAGLLKILALTPKDANVPAFVPDDTVKFSRVRLDTKQTWDELMKVFASISPQGLATVNSAIDMANTFGQQKNPGFDLRAGLLGNLGDDMISYQKPVRGDTLADLSSPPTIFLMSVANPDQTIDAFKIVAGLLAPQDPTAKPREFLGRKITTIALAPARNAATGVTTPRSLYLATGYGYLAMSTDTSMIEEFLRSADGSVKPLRENDGLADAAFHVGGAGGGLFGYENQRETMRVSFKALKNSATADTAMEMFPPAFREWADFSLLPDFGQVQKYFYLSAFAASVNADGITLKVFNPRPPTLN